MGTAMQPTRARRALARTHQADYALFLYVRDSYATAGRVAVIIVGTLLGAAVVDAYWRSLKACERPFRRDRDLLETVISRIKRALRGRR